MPIKKESVKHTHRIRKVSNECKDVTEEEHQKAIIKPKHQIHQTFTDVNDNHEEEKHHVTTKKVHTKPAHRIHRTTSESKDEHEKEHHIVNKKGHARVTHKIQRSVSENADDGGKHHIVNKKGHTKQSHISQRTSSETVDDNETEDHHKANKDIAKSTHRIHRASREADDALEKDKDVGDKHIKEYCWKINKTDIDTIQECKSIKPNESDTSVPAKGFRWAAEFMAGPGGFLEKAEIVSEWFETLDDAKNSAFEKAEDEVCDYPFSRGNLLKLIVEDKNGNEIDLKTASKDI